MRSFAKWIVPLLVVAIAFTCTGCSERGASPKTETSKSESDSASLNSEPKTASDAYYPHTAPAVWLDDGKILAVPDGNIIRYLGMDNRVQKTVELPLESIIGDCGYFLTDNRIFVRGGYDGENYPGNSTALLLDGKWELVNASIFDGDGKLLRAFPRYTETQMPDGATQRALSDGRTLPDEGCKQSVLEMIGWVTDDLVVLNGRNRLFFYRLSTDTLTLSEDMSEWMKQYGKFSVYNGVERIFPYSDGAFYFAHKNEEKSNHVGTVWYADEKGTEVLFDGQEFQSCMGNEQMLVMVSYEGETEDTRKAHVFYARTEDLVLHELDMEVSWVNPNSYLYGSLAAMETSSTPQAGTDGFYVLDIKDGAMERYVPSQMNQQCELIGAWRDTNGFQYIYSLFDTTTGKSTYYCHHSATGQTELLKSTSYIAGNQSISTDLKHFIEYAPDFYESVELRIRPLK